MQKIFLLLTLAATALSPAVALSDSSTLYPLMGTTDYQVFVQEPFCEGKYDEFEVTIDYFDSTKLQSDSRFRTEARLINLFLESNWVGQNRCLFNSNPYDLVLNLSFNGENAGRVVYRKDSYNLVFISQQLNLPTENSVFGNLLDQGSGDIVTRLNGFINDPSSSTYELQLAYFKLGKILGSRFLLRNGDRYPHVGELAEDAWAQASRLGSGVATVELLNSSGLLEEMRLVFVNANRGNALLTDKSARLYAEYGYLFERALSQHAIVVAKLNQELNAYGISASDTLDVASDAPPNRYSLERALLRGAARNFDVYDAFWTSAYPEIPDNFMASCDQDWCYSIGNMIQFRFSVLGNPNCGAMSDGITQCSFKMKPVSMINPSFGLNNTAQGQLFGMFRAAIPYQSATATFQRIDDRWELSSGIQME